MKERHIGLLCGLGSAVLPAFTAWGVVTLPRSTGNFFADLSCGIVLCASFLGWTFAVGIGLSAK